MVGAAGFEPATLWSQPDALPGSLRPERLFYRLIKSFWQLKDVLIEVNNTNDTAHNKTI